MSLPRANNFPFNKFQCSHCPRRFRSTAGLTQHLHSIYLRDTRLRPDPPPVAFPPQANTSADEDDPFEDLMEVLEGFQTHEEDGNAGNDQQAGLSVEHELLNGTYSLS